MADVLNVEQRRRCMSNIRGKNTRPELVVRGLLSGWGRSYRTHASELPGNPDIVFRTRRQAILIHGCFWHRHNCSLGRPMPTTRVAFWKAKLIGNKARDRRNIRALRRLGWRVLIVWECQTRKPTYVAARISRFLKEKEPTPLHRRPHVSLGGAKV
jgi:DNA mismatch endonuclease, patch repair protein